MDANGRAVDAVQAERLGRLVRALRELDATDGPPPGEHNSFRGAPLARRDRSTRAAIAALRDDFDSGAVSAAWDAALRALAWDGPLRWIHGDLIPGNVLLEGDAISAVIDFGTLGVGDPACDLMPAWTLCDASSRLAFHEATGERGEAAWSRGRGWALSWALIVVPYYRDTNPALVAAARRTIAEVLSE